MNQSEFIAITYNLLKAQGKSSVQVAIGLVLLLIGWKSGARFLANYKAQQSHPHNSLRQSFENCALRRRLKQNNTDFKELRAMAAETKTSLQNWTLRYVECSVNIQSWSRCSKKAKNPFIWMARMAFISCKSRRYPAGSLCGQKLKFGNIALWLPNFVKEM